MQVLLVTSSRRPNNWIVPGGGVEPNEEPARTAVREVLEEAGVIGTLGRCLGMFEVRPKIDHSTVCRSNSVFLPQNYEHKHRTKVYVMNVTDEMADWEDSRNMDRKRQWFSIEDALQQLALHKPVQRSYLQQLKNSKSLTSTPSTSSGSTATTIDQTITSNSEAVANRLPPTSPIQIESTTN